MSGAYFLVTRESAERGSYLADESTGGPWAAGLQHGGPPNALLVAAAERVAEAETGRSDLVGARLAAEFVGPVPVAELSTEARVVRSARSAVLVEATLSAAQRECLCARVWFVAARDTGAVTGPAMPIEVADGRAGLPMSFPYGDSLEWRMVSGALDRAGPGTAWVRPRQPLIAGRELSGLQRAVLIGDSASGISSELDWSAWSFVNIDLDVHLARPIRGEWLLMDAATQLGPTGLGLARSTLSDVDGPVGATAQTLVLAPRRR